MWDDFYAETVILEYDVILLKKTVIKFEPLKYAPPEASKCIIELMYRSFRLRKKKVRRVKAVIIVPMIFGRR
jgi:hypothetical protein